MWWQLAKDNIFLEAEGEQRYIAIDNELMHSDREQGLVLHVDNIIDENTEPERSYSTSIRFVASGALRRLIGDEAWCVGQRIAIGDKLVPELFSFRRSIRQDVEGQSFLENNLIQAMPWILTSKHPALAAAKVNTQMEFDRAYRSILRAPEYQGRNLLFISGIHIDISPRRNQVFPLTKFIPWAAYHRTAGGESTLYEQNVFNQILRAQSVNNPAQIDLEEAIRMMEEETEVTIDAR